VVEDAAGELSAKTKEIVQALAEKLEKHHIFPQKFKEWFADQGIKIHQWTIKLTESQHDYAHEGGTGGGWWNRQWGDFITKNPEPTIDHIFQKAEDMLLGPGLPTGPIGSYYGR
jgi:hypothetical protein